MSREEENCQKKVLSVWEYLVKLRAILLLLNIYLACFLSVDEETWTSLYVIKVDCGPGGVRRRALNCMHVEHQKWSEKIRAYITRGDASTYSGPSKWPQVISHDV